MPLTDPAFVLLVSIDEPLAGYEPGVGHTSHAGVCAAPVFREVARRSLAYLGVAPDDPHGYPPGDPRRNFAEADWEREAQMMREVYEQWNH